MIQIILGVIDFVAILLFLGTLVGLIMVIVKILQGDGCLSKEENETLNLRLKILSGVSVGSLLIAIILSTILFALFKTRISKRFPYRTVFNVFQYTFLLISVVLLTMIIYWCIRMIKGEFCKKSKQFKMEITILLVLFLVFFIPTLISTVWRIIKASGKIFQWLFQSAKFASQPQFNTFAKSINPLQAAIPRAQSFVPPSQIPQIIPGQVPILNPPISPSQPPYTSTQYSAPSPTASPFSALLSNPGIQQAIGQVAQSTAQNFLGKGGMNLGQLGLKR